MTDTRLIGFHGSMGAGKSTAIATLEGVLGFPPTLEKFAGMLYRMQDLLYAEIEATGVYRRPPEFIKDRKLLQWLGTDWGRETLDQDIWVNIWKAKVEAALAAGHFVVCDDVRFDNEAALIRTYGGKVVKIIRPNAVAHAQGGAGIQGHKSEAGVSPRLIDGAVVNNGSLEEYKQRLADLYELLGITPVNG